MKRIAFGVLAAAAIALVTLIGSGRTAPANAQLEISFRVVLAQFTSVTLAPLDQTRETTDTAQLVATLNATGCVLEGAIGPGSPSNPSLLASLCPLLQQQLDQHGSTAPATTITITELNPFAIPGSFDVVSGLHQGSVHVPLAFPVNPAQFINMTPGQPFSFQSQAVASYVDFDHRVGTDTGQATAFVSSSDICEIGLVATITEGGVTQPESPCEPGNLASNPADVRWIKTGAIDTGIFVRRTPVVEQAAAPAAPAVQAPATGTGRITAPNTGDAGLQASGNSSSGLALPLAIALGLAGLGGAFVLHRRRRAA